MAKKVTEIPMTIEMSKEKKKSIKQLYSGGVPSLRGTIIKIVMLALIDAVALSVAFVLLGQSQWVALAVLLAVVVIVNWLYLRPAGLPGKYLAPGVLFLLAFQVYVLFLSTTTAFTNYGSAHNGDFNQALSSIIDGTVTPDDTADFYDAKVVKSDATGRYAFLLTNATYPYDPTLTPDPNDPATQAPAVYVGGPDLPLTQLAEADYTLDTAPNDSSMQYDAIAAKGYTLIEDPSTLSDEDQTKLGAYHILLDPNKPRGQFLMAEDLQNAQTYNLDMVWNAKKQTLTRQSDGAVFKPSTDGFFHVNGNIKKETIETGWQVSVGVNNFISIFTDPELLRPLGRVLTWTFIFAISTVLTTFVLGLAIALLFDYEKLRGKKLYRSFMILPYAFPGFLSAYVWRGLFNTEHGFVNNTILGGLRVTQHLAGGDVQTMIPWLEDANWAKLAVLLVNLWLGFPYMFLITTGALQAIPSELTESATIDGATPWQTFRLIKLPLLLVSLAPLLISSFAFNFNNFTLIYLLTGGGPTLPEEVNAKYDAGGTDILITFVYKIAFSAGKGRDYGMASAFSILIFIVVGGLSLISFRRTKALEEMN
jgi:arabinogalactan oligomer/maltooligosaccharide transport system permease protein